jgi:hypothetical protein
MHFIIGFAAFVALVAYAFGPSVARAFTGAFLGLSALAVLFLVTHTIKESSQWSAEHKHQQTLAQPKIQHSMELPGLTEDQIRTVIRDTRLKYEREAAR